MNMGDKTGIFVVLGTIALLAGITLATSGNVDTAAARRALEAQGLSHISLNGYSFLGCGKGEGYSTSFSAIGANGKFVQGVVCSGLFKNVTVRYE